jgi:hypothetical protein
MRTSVVEETIPCTGMLDKLPRPTLSQPCIVTKCQTFCMPTSATNTRRFLDYQLDKSRRFVAKVRSSVAASTGVDAEQPTNVGSSRKGASRAVAVAVSHLCS